MSRKIVHTMSDGTRIELEREAYVSVIATDARSALAFFGFRPGEAWAVDAGPPADPHRWKPNARRWHVYRNKGDMPS